MTGWTAEELSVIDRTDELDLQSERADGSLRDQRRIDDIVLRQLQATLDTEEVRLTHREVIE